MSQNHFVVYYNLEWHDLIEDNDKFKYAKFNISTMEDSDQIISFQTSDLIREYSSRKKSIPQIIDLESLDMQMSQKGRDIRFWGKWSIFRRLVELGIISSYNDVDDIHLFLRHINTFYDQLIEGAPEEFERFLKVEQDINRIIYEAQARGLSINKQDIEERCYELENQIYKIKNRFQLQHRIFTPDRKETQINWLNDNKYKVYNSAEETFKAHKKNNNICLDFYELIRNIKDYNCYLYMLSHWGGEDRIYPMYVGFGTITSRITMRQPSIQNLRKQNRDIIKADIGKVLIYVDYSQFEAGILASLSKDCELLKLYESDIYEDLAAFVYNNKDRRSDAKIIFYRYMYGDDSLNEKTKQYFNRFKDLQRYINSIHIEIEKEGKIGSAIGNYRIAAKDAKVPWALSHKIQSTASLIFKNALIRVNKELKDVDLLIPLHDAALYQVPESKYTQYESILRGIFEDEFQAICPKINAKALICEFCK